MKSIQEVFKIGKGPSSSHTIGPERAAALFKTEHPDADSYRVILYESLSKTGQGHGTDRVLREVFSPKPAEIVFAEEAPADLPHPNTMDFEAVRDGRVTVIDYKFGAERPAYARQVARYADIYRRMGYAQVDTVLWYVPSDRTVRGS